MIRDGVGPCSASKAIGLLSSMMNRAIVWGYIERNPCQHVERPRPDRKRAIVALAPSQVEAIRSTMSPRDRTIVSVLGYAGLRPGECLGLTWGDLRERTILVDKAVAHGELKVTKTRRERSVTLLPSLARDLAEWRLASGRPGDRELVFPNSRGAPWTDAKFRNWRRRYFEPAVDRAGMTGVTPYTLRHSFASLLLASGAGLPEVAGEMGHSVGVLTSTYAHAIAEFRGSGRVDPESAIRGVRSRLTAREAVS
jgi:integrase